MGASIQVSGRTSIIEGTPSLSGATIKASDLRAGAALIIAGLCARGETVVEGVSYVERGYEKMIRKLSDLGADIKSEYVPEERAPVGKSAG
jgi:UDP-N-acetylglucosamine 1-carboxyvinyltransferase